MEHGLTPLGGPLATADFAPRPTSSNRRGVGLSVSPLVRLPALTLRIARFCTLFQVRGTRQALSELVAGDARLTIPRRVGKVTFIRFHVTLWGA